MRWIFATLFCLSFSAASQAEYRVYELSITDNESGESRTVIGTLDDIQYPGYYPLRRTEKIELIDTWMCWGRHGEGQKPCPNPRPEPSTAVPSTRSTPVAAPAGP